jgi:hypothetical protein
MRLAPRWRALLAVALCGGLVTACGGSSDKSEKATSNTVPSISFPTTLATTPPLLTGGADQRAAPRWEQVKVVAGNGNVDALPVNIVAGAIQWRVKWNCDGGTLTIETTPPPPKPGPLVSSPCPGSGEGFARQTGDVMLSIKGSGPWKATVEQQVDTPLDEPPLPEMATAKVLAKGDFYNVEKTGKGTVTLYQFTDGQRALRIEQGFEVLNDPDLVVWLSTVANPKTSKEMSDAPHVELQALKSTRGSQNYKVPDNVSVNPIRSVGLYCVPVPSVYIAATLS